VAKLFHQLISKHSTLVLRLLKLLFTTWLEILQLKRSGDQRLFFLVLAESFTDFFLLAPPLFQG